MSSRSDLNAIAIAGEAIRVAIARPTGSALTGLIVVVACAVILTTTGQTVRAEEAVIALIDDVGTRSITLVDEQGTLALPTSLVDHIAQLSDVDWVFGLGFAEDARNAALSQGGNPVVLRTVYGLLPDEVGVGSRPAVPGEALVSRDAMHTLGLAFPVGAVDVRERQLAVVGDFAATGPLTFLNDGLLAPSSDDREHGPLRSVHVLAASPSSVEQLTEALLMMIDTRDSSSLSVRTSQTLADLRAVVRGELGRHGRDLVLVVLGVGLLLIALSIYGSVTLHRQDFGRRRALGATRATIVALVMYQYLAVSTVGATLGTLVGVAAVVAQTGESTDVRFAAATSILAILTALVAAIIPALIAAGRDPVKVLRTP